MKVRIRPALDVLSPDKPAVFIHVEGNSVRDSSGSSYNEEEVKVVKALVRGLLNCKVKANGIGIVTPYRAQRSKILEEVKKLGIIPEVDTVDAFQGREKDVIIFSVTSTKSFRFAAEPHRLNVALTRPRCKLIVIGDGKAIYRKAKKTLLYNFLEFCYYKQRIYNWKEKRWMTSK